MLSGGRVPIGIPSGMSPLRIRPAGGAPGCLVMILVSVLASVLLTILLNVLLR
jgi:hypothetical protein